MISHRQKASVLALTSYVLGVHAEHMVRGTLV